MSNLLQYKEYVDQAAIGLLCGVEVEGLSVAELDAELIENWDVIRAHPAKLVLKATQNYVVAKLDELYSIGIYTYEDLINEINADE